MPGDVKVNVDRSEVKKAIKKVKRLRKLFVEMGKGRLNVHTQNCLRNHYRCNRSYYIVDCIGGN